MLTLTAENIHNLGGRLDGRDVGVQARADLDNLGGRITAIDSLTAVAGQDLNVASITRTQSNDHGSRTNIGRVAGLYVSGAGATLLASAGRDVNLNAAAVLNAADAAGQSGGATVIAAGRDLILGTVQEAAANRIVWDANNHRSDATRTDAGTLIQTQGELRLQAGQDLNASAAQVTSEQGALLATAGRNVNLAAGQQNAQVDEAHRHTSKGTFSRKTITTRDVVDRNTALASTFSGDTTTIVAGQDIHVTGSNVVSSGGTVLAAQRDIAVQAAIDTSTEQHFREEKKSGLFSSGGIGFTIGTRQQSVDQGSTSTVATASTLGSTQGNVAIGAGSAYRQAGSDVIAPQGDIAIAAQQVDIREARETSRTQTETRFKQSGLTVAITSPVLSAIQTAQQMSKAARQTGDSRMHVLAAANTALAVKNAANAIQAGQGAVINNQPNQIRTGTDSNGNPTSRDANAADQAGGINLSISIGSSKSQSSTVQTADQAIGSTVAGGGDIRIAATGAGDASNLTIQGSTVAAGGDIVLQADNRIDLLAAQSTAAQTSTNSSSSGSIGISIGTGGFGVTVAASKGRGNADGNDVTWSNTHVDAGNRLTMTSGGDTTLRGAVARGQQVIANVGGNLAIESLQDTSVFNSRQQSLGGSLTIGVGVSGSISASRSKTNSNYASVTEQSGIRAGDGGFQVKVVGDTALAGGAITSTQQAIDDQANRFATGGTLQLADIQNHASYDARSAGINIGSSIDLAGKLAPAGSGAGFGKEDGQAASTTQAAISGIAGNREARTGDSETGIARIFDAERVQREIDAQQQITQLFGQLAPKAAADFAKSRADNLLKQAAKESDPVKRDALLRDARKWEEGGMYRIALHATLGGAAGGIQGAAGAATVASAANVLNDMQAGIEQSLIEQGMGKDAAKRTAQGILAATTLAVGAAVGGTNGAAMAFSVDANNRQLHPNERKLIEKLAKEKAAQECRGNAQCEKLAILKWSDAMERVAESLTDDKEHANHTAYITALARASADPRSEGARGYLDGYLADLETARAMLAPYMGKVIMVNGVVMTSQGAPQTYFGATQAQRADYHGNVFPGQKPSSVSSVAPLMHLRDEARLEHFGAWNGAATPIYPVEELLLGGALGNRIAGTVGRWLNSLDAPVAAQVGVSNGFTRYLNNSTNPEIRTALIDEVANLRASLPVELQSKGNLAYAKIDVPGIPENMKAFSRFDAGESGYVSLPNGSTTFKPLSVDKYGQVDTAGSFLRDVDGEFKILENIAKTLGDNPAARGRIDLFTELKACTSCGGAIVQFRAKYPGIQLNVFTGK